MIRLLKIKEDKTQDEKYIEMIRDYFPLIKESIKHRRKFYVNAPLITNIASTRVV